MLVNNIFKRRTPDILECIANLSSDEVFTPPGLANSILDLLPKEVWLNKDLNVDYDSISNKRISLNESFKIIRNRGYSIYISDITLPEIKEKKTPSLLLLFIPSIKT